jgi:medium-chain acyl-[acyl-carrier-protein] hydrolase
MTGKWFTTPQPNPRAQLRLFCFPYAGGTAQIYREWPAGLPSFVEVCAVQLPGRGARLGEPALTNLLAVVEAAAPSLQPYFDRPFAFFGHSMGAIIAFELARHLRSTRAIEPTRLFVSGHGAPQIPSEHGQTYQLPDAEFVESLRRLNGTPEEVLSHPELLELMLPLLRADFEAIETYAYTEGEPLNCPITAFGGLQDLEVSRQEIEGWRAQTSSRFMLRMLPGDHFFIHSAQRLLLQTLSRELHELK